MIFALLLALVGIALLIFGIFFSSVNKDTSNEDVQRKMANDLKRQTEILERNRMESYSRSSHFKD
jgi:hypothetical protein